MWGHIRSIEPIDRLHKAVTTFSLFLQHKPLFSPLGIHALKVSSAINASVSENPIVWMHANT